MPDIDKPTAPSPEPWADVTTLTLVWSAAIGSTPPVGSHLRTALPERWVRFHYLPDGERIATSTEQRSEVVNRYRAVLTALTAAAEEKLLVTTCGWARATPAPRPPDLAALMPGTLWHDVAPENPADSTTTVYATAVPPDVTTPQLTDLLLLWAADERTADIIIAPPSCAWLFHPYDGGMDVIARDPIERDRLAEQFSSWLSDRDDGL